jgi:putative flippase GtrA
MQQSDDTSLRLSEHREVIAQLIRYGVTGGVVTLIGVGVYWLCVTSLGASPLLATFAAYVVAVMIGYVLHSRFSFKGHGSRDNPIGTTSRFFAGSVVSYLLNSLFVWIVTGPMAFAPEWGIVPMVFVTPLIIFVINRIWVFR